MEVWELIARESIRDLVARYNANGDSGRFEAVRSLFADDAVMVIGATHYQGIDEIMSIFVGARDRLAADVSGAPGLVRHMVSTHQIDLVDADTATGRAYFAVLTSIGLDHWGRYVDRYRRVEDRWLFAARTVTVDGYAAGSQFTAPDMDTD